MVRGGCVHGPGGVHGPGCAWSGGCMVGGVPGEDTPPPTATAADGTHPTGMHSCIGIFRRSVGWHLNFLQGFSFRGANAISKWTRSKKGAFNVRVALNQKKLPVTLSYLII